MTEITLNPRLVQCKCKAPDCWVIPYDGLYGEVPWLPPERRIFFFRLQVYEWIGNFSKRSTVKGRGKLSFFGLKKKQKG